MYLDLKLHKCTFRELNVRVNDLIIMTVRKDATSSTTPFETHMVHYMYRGPMGYLLASARTCASPRSNGYCSPYLLLRPSSRLLVIGLFESIARAELGVVIQCSTQIGDDGASLIGVSVVSTTEKLRWWRKNLPETDRSLEPLRRSIGCSQRARNLSRS
jgi:hypothetical protein